jgi:hypothetical protein
MLFRRALVSLGFEHLQGLDKLLPRLVRLDYGIHVSSLGGDVGVGEAVAEFFDFLLAGFGAVLGTV